MALAPLSRPATTPSSHPAVSTAWWADDPQSTLSRVSLPSPQTCTSAVPPPPAASLAKPEVMAITPNPGPHPTLPIPSGDTIVYQTGEQEVCRVISSLSLAQLARPADLIFSLPLTLQPAPPASPPCPPRFPLLPSCWNHSYALLPLSCKSRSLQSPCLPTVKFDLFRTFLGYRGLSSPMLKPFGSSHHPAWPSSPCCPLGSLLPLPPGGT